ncbi:hypothetical protein [Nostoc sp.]
MVVQLENIIHFQGIQKNNSFGSFTIRELPIAESIPQPTLTSGFLAL